MPARDIPEQTLRIDAHHHLWHYSREEYGWLDGELDVLRRDHLIAELQQQMLASRVAGAVAVQARQTLEETEWLLQLAGQHQALLGVVGWLPIAANDFSHMLGHYTGNGILKGLRHVVQVEPAGFLDGADFNRGIRSLAGTKLVYDILIHEHQLAEAARFVQRHPEQTFVLDHLAKPRIAAREMRPWAQHLQELARFSNVTCKLSGLVTEASREWKPTDLKPYFDVALEAFTPERLMVGSDWPVLTPRCSYEHWWEMVTEWVAPFSLDERADVLGRTAVRTYQLDLPE